MAGWVVLVVLVVVVGWVEWVVGIFFICNDFKGPPKLRFAIVMGLMK